MFFFFVGGVEQQVRRVIKEAAGRCIRCGSYTDLVEYDNVLKVFFVPVWRWPGREPAIYCQNCSLFLPQSFSLPPSNQSPMLSEALRCHSCLRVVDPDFQFCPYCGTELQRRSNRASDSTDAAEL